VALKGLRIRSSSSCT